MKLVGNGLHNNIEPRLRKVMGYRHLPKLRNALRSELKVQKNAAGTEGKRNIA